MQEPGASRRAAAAAEESEKGARGVVTAAPAGRATASADHAATPSTPRKRGPDPARATGASPAAATAAKEREEGARGVAAATPAGRATASASHAATPNTPRKQGTDPRTGHGRLAGGRDSSRGERGGRARSCDRGPGGPRHGLGRPRRDPQHAAQAGEESRTGHGRLAGGRRSSSSGQGEREVPRPRQPHPHPHQPPQAVPPQALPPGAGAARPPPGARALAARRHAVAAAKTAGHPARDSGRRGGRAGRAACQPRERGARGRRR